MKGFDLRCLDADGCHSAAPPAHLFFARSLVNPFKRAPLCVPVRHLRNPASVIVHSLFLLSVVSANRPILKFMTKLLFEVSDIWPALGDSN